MKRLTTREAFSGEVPFTQALCSNKTIQQELNNFLIDKLDFDLDLDKTKYEHQVALDFSGRVDIVVHQYGEPSFVIECQDARGDLDMLHIMKSIAYAHEVGVEDIVLLAEEVSVEAVRLVEHLRSFGHSIYLVTYDIFQFGNEQHLAFRSIANPRKLVVNTSSRSSYDDRARERKSELNSAFFAKYQERLGLTNVSSEYASRNTYPGLAVYANIRPQRSRIDLLSRKYDMIALEEALSAHFPSLEMRTKDQGNRGRVTIITGFDDEEHLAEIYGNICQLLDNKEVVLTNAA